MSRFVLTSVFVVWRTAALASTVTCSVTRADLDGDVDAGDVVDANGDAFLGVRA